MPVQLWEYHLRKYEEGLPSHLYFTYRDILMNVNDEEYVEKAERLMKHFGKYNMRDSESYRIKYNQEMLSDVSYLDASIEALCEVYDKHVEVNYQTEEQCRYMNPKYIVDSDEWIRSLRSLIRELTEHKKRLIE